jgi:hypothetical protein
MKRKLQGNSKEIAFAICGNFATFAFRGFHLDVQQNIVRLRPSGAR